MKTTAFLQLLASESAAHLAQAWQGLTAEARGEVARHTFANGETALHVVARRGLVPLLEPLVRAGADVDARDASRLTPLHLALRAGHSGLAVMLLDAGADIDAYGQRGLTMLHQAVISGQADAVAWLLAYGANVRLPAYDMERHDMNALHLAATSTPDVLRLLLRAADAAAVNDVYYNKSLPYDALRTVLAQQRADLLDVLIDYGVNINAAGVDGLTPVQFLLCHRTSMVDSVDLLRRLHDAGADMLQTTGAGNETLLMLATSTGWVQAFDYLLTAGVSPHAPRADGTTLLHIAARGMRHDLFLRVLSILPHHINAQNNLGQTPLWLAAHHNRRDNVVALLAAGADPTLADKKMRTPDMVCQAPMQRMTRKLVMDAQRRWPDSAKQQRGRRNLRGAQIRNRRGRGGFYPSKRR